MTTATADTKRHAAAVVRHLRRQYPDATCSLNFENPLELLVATILSAQCTDQRVNLVTKDLFAKFPAAEDYARASPTKLERAIRSTGFFRNKAKAIRGCCGELLERHGGEVPRNLEQLVRLPGVGRKTANVILGTGFGIASGVVVDTHVGRLSRRLGLSTEKNPEKVERDLMQLVPKKEWIVLSHRLILHGRRVCSARSPRCGDCTLARWCPSNGTAEPVIG